MVVLLAAITAAYLPARHAVRVTPAGDYTYKPEVHRIRTPHGEATIWVEDARLPGYKNVDTGPEGYALAIKTPRRVAFEVELANNEWIDHVDVDGRTVKIPDSRKIPRWVIRLAGGEHFVVLAWRPTE